MISRTLVRSDNRPNIVFYALLLMLIPFSTHADTTKPTCALTVETSVGTAKIVGENTILLKKGDELQIQWKSKNATKALNEKGKTISLFGVSTSSPKKDTTYEYRFSNGSKKVSCSVTVDVVSGGFATSTLLTASSRSLLSGKAIGAKSVQVKIYKEGTTSVLYTSNVIKVSKNGTWKTKVTKKLKNGTYDVVLLGNKKALLNTIASGTLSVGTTTSATGKSDTIIVVVPVPLLAGGIARSGATIPLSYLQVVNLGKVSTTIHGFTIKQNGSTNIDAITALTVSDDSKLLHGSVTKNDGSLVFKNGSAVVPIEAVLAPDQMRLFTLKAVLASTLTQYAGTQLKMDIVGVTTSALLKNTFPVRGVVWKIQ